MSLLTGRVALYPKTIMPSMLLVSHLVSRVRNENKQPRRIVHSVCNGGIRML